MHARQRSVDVDVDDFALGRQRNLLEPSAAEHAGVVHQDVEPARCRGERLEFSGPGGGVGDVERPGHHLGTTNLVAKRLQSGAVNVVGADPITMPRERQRDGAANPGGGPGDEN